MKIGRAISHLTLGILALPLFICCAHIDTEPHKIPSEVELREGDLIFRKGGSIASLLVRASDPRGEYTHVGIITLEHGDAMAIHSVPDEVPKGEVDRIKIEPLEEFFKGSKAENGAIYRASKLNEEQLAEVANHARRWLTKGVEFDHKFILGDTTQLYCTELIQLVFNYVDYEISAGNVSEFRTAFYDGFYLFPSDILKNDELELIFRF